MSEHYDNHPNDHLLSPFEKKLMSKLNKLKHKMKVYGIRKQINIMLLRSQIKADSNLKNMFEEMYPKEYENALATLMIKHGATKKKEVRREEIIIAMNLKDRNILREKDAK